MKQAKIKIILVGTEGQLDLPEEEYVVRHLRPGAENAKQMIMEILQNNPDYKNYGWTIFSAHKILTNEEVEGVLIE